MDRYGYETPGDGSRWIKCAMCDRPFKVFRYQLREGTKFCSRFCCWTAQRAFTRALADGRLNGILALERERAKAKRLSTFSDSTEYSEMEARYARQYLPSQ
jgi:hypothetical protein